LHRIDEIRARRDEIYAIARRHKAEKLWVFGSCARREERPDSDIDLLVKFGKGVTLFDYVGFQQDAEDAMACPVDVVDVENLGRDPAFAANAEREMVAL